MLRAAVSYTGRSVIRVCAYQCHWSGPTQTSAARPVTSHGSRFLTARPSRRDWDRRRGLLTDGRAHRGTDRVRPLRDHRHEGEGEEPRDVEVEPVGHHELGADDQRAGEGGELERVEPPRSHEQPESGEAD